MIVTSYRSAAAARAAIKARTGKDAVAVTRCVKCGGWFYLSATPHCRACSA
jgi:ABC-type ATPase with predicted acetyltransferase domain